MTSKAMKKLSGILMMAAVLMFTATACLDEETSAVDVSGDATIKGIVFANTDDTEAGDERVNGARVRVRYNVGQLSVVNTGDERWEIIEATTDANGRYSVTVPATPKGVNFQVYVDDFDGTHKYDDGGDDRTVEAVYFFPVTPVNNVTVGETRIVDIESNDETIYF